MPDNKDDIPAASSCEGEMRTPAGLVAHLNRLALKIAARPVKVVISIEDMYDENGLPK